MSVKQNFRFYTVGIITAFFLSTCGAPTNTASPTTIVSNSDVSFPTDWVEEVSNIIWVAYSPTNSDLNKKIDVSQEDIRADLTVLQEAGFTGLVTYGSTGIMGKDLPALAQEAGFKGLIMGVWDPTNQEELSNAEVASNNPIVLGYSIGNEGLNVRYELPVLSSAIENLRKVTRQPVTTTEEFDDYYDKDLLELGDWVFPNAHPYFHGQIEPVKAVKWTEGAYQDLERRTDRFIFFKEVGLPTDGDDDGKLSEAGQNQYYQELEKTNVLFVYFEAFDQPWKAHFPIEPHWGIFFSDRTPKKLAYRLMGEEPLTPIPIVSATLTPATITNSVSDNVLYIYSDGDSPYNHFVPGGYMGDTGDIQIDGSNEKNPKLGNSSIRVMYSAKGNGPNACDYAPPCKWAGLYWQQPANNWGVDKIWEKTGIDLSAYSRLKFWARSENSCTFEFKVGGIIGDYGDSLTFPRGIAVKLLPEWQEYEIDLESADLSYIIGGFVWSTSWEKCPGGTTFYLDEIRFEK